MSRVIGKPGEDIGWQSRYGTVSTAVVLYGQDLPVDLAASESPSLCWTVVSECYMVRYREWCRWVGSGGVLSYSQSSCRPLISGHGKSRGMSTGRLRGGFGAP